MYVVVRLGITHSVCLRSLIPRARAIPVRYLHNIIKGGLDRVKPCRRVPTLNKLAAVQRFFRALSTRAGHYLLEAGQVDELRDVLKVRFVVVICILQFMHL